MKPIITIKNISKKYNITHQQGGYIAMRDVLTEIAKKPFSFLKHKAKKIIGKTTNEVFWALKDIDFEVHKGEAIGIIGPNGSGKSTLLKILTGITPPTTGEIRMHGKVASLLEVGTGFHPELTGRENIFLNGAILGMSKKEIAEKFDAIVEFSGVSKFIDTPIKRYSSGMLVRLGFSVAAHMEPDILLVDEVLAVGDADFQKKCIGKMDEVTKEEGRTILFVSHDMTSIQKLCKKCVLLRDGKIEMIGETREVISKYLENSQKPKENIGLSLTKNEKITIDSLRIKKHLEKNLYYDDPLNFELLITNNCLLENLQIGIQIINSELNKIMTATVKIPKIENGKNKLSIIIEKPHLPQGNYYINLGITNIFYKERILYFMISTKETDDELMLIKKDTLGVYPPTSYILNKIK
ncbi:ATP-binding cassette domain-containing protein [Patescibacteria group bacterium]|nr:ATP-binding cassette domain-containing protein [Patescibacteria group bacterium]